MNKQQIEKWIKEAHGNAVDKGFYQCENCEGTGKGVITSECDICYGSKIDPNKNIGELLMLIVSELGEALEAHRCGRFADFEQLDRLDWKNPFYPMSNTQQAIFETTIKDTFEDEIADVFIRLFDLCGYLEIDIESENWKSQFIPERSVYNNVAEELFNISVSLRPIWKRLPSENIDDVFAYILSRLIAFCRESNIPIEKHIDAKMAYNKTRPHKHGKDY